ncbi:hypothetical protein, conserved [Trypanosoma cruzi]|uniref:Uncharacterized protein n=1 Tax=Trypanosoma cruzi (strain CL Brener) TaxID=353153 RepID=Q4DH49_TRYCC|nr:hypothetical protein, conserved [Trypanosoma cruzi]EAN91854.1 hypothetical protein, conserved [Trypanosoma cruzi]|eukprot:XP_813705.1 hypothetical protein [Trypanosoma cruzi strain CL Brener]
MLALVKRQCGLENSHVFYGAYHSEWRNKLADIFCMPILFVAAQYLLSQVDLTSSVDLSHFTACLFAAFYIHIYIWMEFFAGVP